MAVTGTPPATAVKNRIVLHAHRRFRPFGTFWRDADCRACACPARWLASSAIGFRCSVA